LKQILSWAGQVLFAFAVTILLMVGFLLPVVVARPLMIAGLAAAFAIVLASVFSPWVRAWIEAPG
jgi:hypothetical protein